MISKQKVTDFLSEGMRIAVTVVLKNKKEIEFVREDENDYKGFYLNTDTIKLLLISCSRKRQMGREFLKD